MPKKRNRPPSPAPSPVKEKETLGLSPAVLGKRDFVKKDYWCPSPSSNDFDPYSDPFNPKTVNYSQVVKADEIIKESIPSTPLLKSKCCDMFGMDLYFKIETGSRTGCFHERSALYALLMLTPEERKGGVFTASVGNWAMSLAYQGQILRVNVTVVLPAHTQLSIISHCQDYGANVVLHGKTVFEARKRAFKIIHDQGGHGVYISGYDHPNVIAAAGSIGIEILDQLPDTEAILVPIGGGGLIAGIAAFVKHVKPNVLIYGIEPGKSCSFAKAMQNESPYKIEAEMGLAASLTIPKVGDNAFHTARSLIDKMVLIHDDFTARAIVHLIEMEKIIAEGAGAISLGALMCMPDILPELQGKKVVTIVTGGNIDLWPLKRAMIQGKAVEHRVVPINLVITPRNTDLPSQAFRVLQEMDCNLLHCEFSGNHDWMEENKFMQHSLTIICETKGHKHACLMRHVMEKLFPGQCEFDSEVFKPIVICSCFPKLIY
ncbi:L-threonine dehydratase catabolic TdcB-like [Spodoptera frugiperda]|uniref:L-serine deaminase n=1 Tax=Spodoptera frugiperda TaxID=7108 RepID=A0A9R0DEQ8_SPOFR|nr:L-threonine dehydratase catabolic TdcB-like [Spodoptera frugiperda]